MEEKSVEDARGSRSINNAITQNKVTASEEDDSKKGKLAWRKIFILFLLSYDNFWNAACKSLQAPFFPKEAELKGSTATEYGLIFAVYEMVKFVTAPLFGKLIVKISPRILNTAGTFVAGVACLLFGFLDRIPAGNTYIGLAFAARIIEGIGSAASTVANVSIVAVEFPNSVGKTISLVKAAVGFGLVVGPSIGGALYEVGGFTLPFAVVGGILVIGASLIFFLMPKVGTSNAPPEAANPKKFYLNWGVANFALAITSTTTLTGFNNATLEPHLRKFNLTPSELGGIFVIFGSVYAFTAPIWGCIIDKGADSIMVIIFGYFLSSFGLLFIGPAPFIPLNISLWLVIASILVISLGMSAKVIGSYQGTLKSTLARGFPDDIGTYGMVSALFSSCLSLGSLIGSFLGGFLLDNTGYEYGTIIIFAEESILMISVIIYAFWMKYKISWMYTVQ